MTKNTRSKNVSPAYKLAGSSVGRLEPTCGRNRPSITSGARAEVTMHNKRLPASAVFSIVDGKQAFYNTWPKYEHEASLSLQEMLLLSHIFLTADSYFLPHQHKIQQNAVILEKVPGLSPVAKASIREYERMGIHNNPRPFSSPQMAEQGIVRATTYIRILLIPVIISGTHRVFTVQSNKMHNHVGCSFF